MRPGLSHSAPRSRAQHCVAGLLGPVASTAGRNVVMRGRVAPPSWCAQACMPAQPFVCLLRLLCACTGGCVSAQAAVCLLRLLLSRLHAWSACCVPAQPTVCLLSRLWFCLTFCVPAQPAVCHNTTNLTICMLSLLCDIIELSLLCACRACYVPQYN